MASSFAVLEVRTHYASLISRSDAMEEVRAQIDQVAQTNATVLIRGESGTGKELIARAIHRKSLRGQKPLITVNCAALPETLLESELFGYERGAFTGAANRRAGRFERAEGGTLFLDEIGDLAPAAQIKVLRAIQERTVERLGGSETIAVNVRLIAATNSNLEQAMATGAFREDLYYRVNVFAITAPPLRDRKSDIPLLANHFRERFAREHGKPAQRISPAALDALTAYGWPGNVRELQNAMERAVLVADSDVIETHHLPSSLRDSRETRLEDLPLSEAAAEFEKQMLLNALKIASGCRAESARRLRTTERIVNYKIAKYGIDCRRFKR